jgi:hypothetical protein
MKQTTNNFTIAEKNVKENMMNDHVDVNLGQNIESHLDGDVGREMLP